MPFKRCTQGPFTTSPQKKSPGRIRGSKTMHCKSWCLKCVYFPMLQNTSFMFFSSCCQIGNKIMYCIHPGKSVPKHSPQKKYNSLFHPAAFTTQTYHTTSVNTALPVKRSGTIRPFWGPYCYHPRRSLVFSFGFGEDPLELHLDTCCEWIFTVFEWYSQNLSSLFGICIRQIRENIIKFTKPK